MTARPLDTDGYLRRLGLADPGAPSVAGLRALHAAHVERIPYEALEIQLRRPTSVDPHEAAERIVARRRGGYCYHLNGAFSLLLDALGYDVMWHRAGVQNHSDPAPVGAGIANHLALTVHGLPAPESPSGDWLVDVGLGDALHEPLPLHEGTYAQGPFRYGLRRSTVEPGGWRFDHDPRGSFSGMDFRPERATTRDFSARHEFLSTSPRSSFVRTCSVQRRDKDGVDMLTGCVLRRVGAGASVDSTLETPDEWFDALARVFDLPLTDVDARSREALWERVRTAHESWLGGAKRARIALLGDLDLSQPTHRDLQAAVARLPASIEARWVGTDAPEARALEDVDGLWVIPGTPYRDDAAVDAAIGRALESGVPLLGTCGGFQYAVLALARRLAGIADATHAEVVPEADSVVAPLACSLVGEEREVTCVPGTRLAEICGTAPFSGFHWCNYGVSERYVARLEAAGVVVSARAPDAGVEGIEVGDHPFFVATLFQPQAGALQGAPVHPLIVAFLDAARARAG